MPDVLRRQRELVVETGGGAVISLAFALFAHKVGLVPTLFGAMLIATVLGALASPAAFAVFVAVLAPLPSIGDLVGASIPLALDPLDVLVVIGLGIVVQRRDALGLGTPRLLKVFVVANLLALFVAWYRTYGSGEVTATTLALVVKPAVVVVAAYSVVRLVPPERLVSTVARAMAFALGLIALSIVLQRLGLYRTTYQDAYDELLGAKQYGGLMLNGNSAGSLFGVFAVPAYVLLRATGARITAFIVLLGAFPVLLITLSRSSLAALAAGLVALAVLQRRRLEGARIVIAMSCGAALWVATLGRDQFARLLDSVDGYSQDLNGTLSGRPAIWTQAVNFLTDDHHRWMFGGGLDSFQAYALRSPLQHAFATHNIVLRLLTNGGVVMVAVFALLVFALMRIGAHRADSPAVLALRTAVASALTLGAAIDFDMFSRAATWLWILAFVAAYATTDAAASTNRAAIASTPHLRVGSRIALRTSGEEEADA